MSNGPKKITELPVANTYANTDLVLLVGNVSTNATTYSVTPAVLFANVNATRINVGNTVNVGANSIINATAHFITSNSTVNAIMTATSLTFSNTTAVPFTANVTGVYTTGTVNAASHSVGTTFTANATLVNAAAVNVTGQVNTATFYAATSANVGSAVIANATGIYTTGVANAVTLSAGANFTANTTLANTAAINVVGQTNTATLYVTTSANVGSAVVANATGVYTTGTVNATSHTVGSNFIANSTATTIAANTLTLGTSTIASNGYSYLPNGLKMNFGRFVANTTSQVTFTSAFATAVVAISVTPANTVYLAANVPYVFTSNTTTANIYSASTTTSSNCYYLAIGY